MQGEQDDYYYRLGRHQTVIELNEQMEKSILCGVSPEQMSRWVAGYRATTQGIQNAYRERLAPSHPGHKDAG